MIRELGVKSAKVQPFLINAAMFALCLASQPLSAEVTGSRVGPRPANIPDNGMSKDDIASLTMRSYARCVLGVQRTRIMEYLNTLPGSPNAFKLANNISRDECLASDQLRFNEKLFRWTLYDELFNSNFRNFDVLKIASVPNTDFVALAANLGAIDMETLAVWQLGECTVRAAPAEAFVLVKSAIASKAETAAINAIVPHVGSCLEQGSKLKFSKPVLRGIMAETLYKLAKKSEDKSTAEGGN